MVEMEAFWTYTLDELNAKNVLVKWEVNKHSYFISLASPSSINLSSLYHRECILTPPRRITESAYC